MEPWSYNLHDSSYWSMNCDSWIFLRIIFSSFFVKFKNQNCLSVTIFFFKEKNCSRKTVLTVTPFMHWVVVEEQIKATDFSLVTPTNQPNLLLLLRVYSVTTVRAFTLATLSGVSHFEKFVLLARSCMK